MKLTLKNFLSVLIVFLTLGTSLKWLIGNALGPPDDTVRAPGGGSCNAGGCHGSGNITDPSSDISLSGLPGQYIPGTTYSLTFTLANDVAGNNGFEVTASTGGTSRVGSWSNAGAGSAISGGGAYWKHNGAQTNTSWTANWTAPSSNIGTITFYGAANKGGGAGAGNLHFNNWSVAPEVLTESTGAPTALKVTEISANTITISWTDNSNVEEGFRIIATTGGLYGTVGANATSFQLTGLSPNTLIQAKVSAFSGATASTSTTQISSYTLANSPANLSFISVGRTQAVISWSSNSNPTSVIYEVSQSTDNFLFQPGISTPIAFSDGQASTSATIGSLSAGNSYYFRVRARNNDSVVTAFSASISTVTQPVEVIQSTGGIVDAGATSLAADPGVSITIESLSDGSAQQTFLSTQSASVSYGNGFSLTLPQGVQTKVVATANGLTLTSTQTVPVKEGNVLIEASSGTISLESSATSLTISIASGSMQNVQATISTETTKSVSLRLNPPTGEISVDIPQAALAESAAVRVKLPDSFPSPSPRTNRQEEIDSNKITPHFASPNQRLVRGESSPAVGREAKGLGIGLEILLDKPIQPKRTVPITMSFRDADIAGVNQNSLILSRFDETAQVWTQLPSKLDSAAKKITGFTTHFSKFQLISVSPSPDISGAKVFPNPFLASKGHTEVKFTNLPADTSVKIYTLLGQLVRELKTDSTGRTFWDLKNSDGQEIASDVYLALIESAGGKKILKVGVQR